MIWAFDIMKISSTMYAAILLAFSEEEEGNGLNLDF